MKEEKRTKVMYMIDPKLFEVLQFMKSKGISITNFADISLREYLEAHANEKLKIKKEKHYVKVDNLLLEETKKLVNNHNFKLRKHSPRTASEAIVVAIKMKLINDLIKEVDEDLE